MPKLRFSREVFQLGNPGNTKHAQTRLTISAASAAAIWRMSARRRQYVDSIGLGRGVRTLRSAILDAATDCDRTVRGARVPMTKGRWDPEADMATSYAWFVWSLQVERKETRSIWAYLQATTATASISTSRS